MTQDKGPTTYREGHVPVTEKAPKHAPVSTPSAVPAEVVEAPAPTKRVRVPPKKKK